MINKPPSSQFQGIKLDQLVYVEFEANGGMMLTVSQSGFSFRAVTPVRPTGRIPFSFTIHGNEKLGGFGKIEWTKDDGKVAGLQFTDVTSDFLQSLRRWLTQLGATPGASYSEARSEDADQPAVPRTDSSAGSPASVHPVESPRLAAFEAALQSATIRQDTVPKPENVSPKPEPGFDFGRSLGLSEPRNGRAASSSFAHEQPEAAASRQAPYISEWKYPDGLADPPPARFSKVAVVAVAICFAALVIALYTSREMLGKTLISLGQKLSRTQENAQTAAPPVTSQPASPAAAPTAKRAVEANVDTKKLTDRPNAPASENSLNTKPPLVTDSRTGAPGTSPPTNVDAVFRDERRSPAPAPKTLEDPTSHDPAAQARSLWAAVAQGNTSAEVTLAKLYLIGSGVDKNCDQAKILFRAAANKGNGEALDKLTQLNRQGCP
jgi:hypothetical protein